MTRAIITISLVTFLMVGCASNSDRGYDNNPAEAATTEGEKDKKNSESNEEARKRGRPTISIAVEDRTFAIEAAEGGLTEVMLSKIALKKSKSEKVKSFATMMIDDHGAANKDLRTLCADKGIILRTNCVRCQAKHDELDALEGDAFDKKYAELMLGDHKTAVDAFMKESEQGKDQELKKWAAGKLPTLRHHLSMAEEMNKLLNGPSKI